MKKTKIMLLVILLMAIVAGAFAIKTYSDRRICLYKGPTNGGVCTTVTICDCATTVVAPPNNDFETFRTTAKGEDCPVIAGIICDQQLTCGEE